MSCWTRLGSQEVEGCGVRAGRAFQLRRVAAIVENGYLCDPAMPLWNRSALANGVRPSCCPDTIKVGT